MTAGASVGAYVLEKYSSEIFGAELEPALLAALAIVIKGLIDIISDPLHEENLLLRGRL